MTDANSGNAQPNERADAAASGGQADDADVTSAEVTEVVADAGPGAVEATEVVGGAGPGAVEATEVVATEGTSVYPAESAPGWTAAPPPAYPTTPPPPPPSYQTAPPPAYAAAPPAGAGAYGTVTPYQQGPQTSNKAVVAMVMAILSFVVCPVILAVAALIVGGQAKQEIAASNGWLTGDGLVTGAKILAWVNIALSVLAVIFMIIFFVALGNTVNDIQMNVEPTGLGT